MRKLKLQMQMTLDGFVSGPNGEMDWMTYSMDNESLNRINELVDSSDTLLLGRKMTDEFVNYWTGVTKNPESPEYEFAQKMVAIPKIVFSKTVKESRWANTSVTNGDLVEEVVKLKNGDGKDILVYGGATFVGSLIKNRLIDEYHFFVNPVAIGEGMSVFADSADRLNLQLIKSEAFSNGEIELTYAQQKKSVVDGVD